MSSHCPEQSRDADLTDEAAAWLAALDAGSADIAAFEAWRDTDVRHAIAFAEVANAWRDLDRLRVARGDMQQEPGRTIPAEPDWSDRRHVLRATASFAAVLVVGGGWYYRANARDKAVTQIGERATVAAAPGLSLKLNTDSCVYWKDGAPDRLWLERGEVAIQHGSAHRLELIVPDGRFELAPGLYNARLRPTGCELAVLRGRIVDGAQRQMNRGEVAVATAGKWTIHSRDGNDMARVTAWQRGTLVLNGESLDYALAEMNRYLANKIVIGDPALSRLRIGGTFATTNPQEFLQALHSSFGVRAISGANGGIVLSRA